MPASHEQVHKLSMDIALCPLIYHVRVRAPAWQLAFACGFMDQPASLPSIVCRRLPAHGAVVVRARAPGMRH